MSCVPAGGFWRPEHAAAGRTKLRFAFPKRIETLRAAVERLEKLRVGAGTIKPDQVRQTEGPLS